MTYWTRWRPTGGTCNGRALPAGTVVVGLAGRNGGGPTLWLGAALAPLPAGTGGCGHAGGAVALGLGFAQYPYLIFPDVTSQDVAVPEATLCFLLYALPFGLPLLVPFLWLLFRRA